jgi:serine/threonine protein kinase
MKERTALSHPNIVRIYDIDEQQGQIAMEYVPGRDLRKILTLKGGFAVDVALYIAIQLVNGLHYAHNQGVVHHALIPEHLLLTRQAALKIIAFRTPSYATRQRTSEKRTAYMPPECFERKKLTVASNVYSFGVIVYEMLAGNLPDLENFPRFELDLPTGVAPILEPCLNPDPARRPTPLYAVGEQLIQWYTQCRSGKADEAQFQTYKDFLLMAWADGKITDEEAEFLARKRQELNISEDTAQLAELEVKRELERLW